MKKILCLSVLLSAISIFASDNVRFLHDNGFGARSLSMSNNFVALSNDLSAIYWNPAALSFSLVREIQASVDASSFESQSSFFNDNVSSTMDRLKISNAGLLYSFPATQGGLTIAFSYSYPLVFDDLSQFSGSFVYDGFDYDLDKNFRTSGGLKYLSGGFGVQLAPGFGIGTSVSFVFGKENYESVTNIKISQDDLFLDSTNYYDINGKYAGYDIRLGAFYKADFFSAGMRFILPQVIKISETAEENATAYYSDYSTPENSSGNNKYSGKMYSSLSSAAGFSLTFPFMTFSSEARVTLPFGFMFPSEKIPSSSQANYYKVGGGVGLEFPVASLPILLRTGYSCDEVDLHRFISKYKGEERFIWSDDNFTVDRNKHQLSAGVGFFNSSVSFDLSYCYSTWKLSQQKELAENLISDLVQDYSLHKFMITLAIRY